MRQRVSFVFGTRPEAIKLCPLVLAMQKNDGFETHVCVTGQHREMLDQVLDVFGVKPDVDLALMQPNQTLSGLTARAINAIDSYLGRHKPDLVIVQGDTTTVFCAALSAFYHRIPVGHVEAGLRTWNKYSPFPEEINRVMASRLADLHFAPTETARASLIKEGVRNEHIFVTGNTVIDALFLAVDKIKEHPPSISGLPDFLQPARSQAISQSDGHSCPMVLITGHRRESFGQGFENICEAIAQLARSFPSVHFVYPVHLNPKVREPVRRILGDARACHVHTAARVSADGVAAATFENVHLIEPLPYLSFVALMLRSTLVLTDSGGVQEEVPSLGKPVLVMRDTTERPEAVEMGTVRLVGTNVDNIVNSVSALLTDRRAYEKMANAVNPYGDGRACQRIVAACADFLNASGER